MGGRRNPFRGFIDTVSEMNRAQQEWLTGGGGEGGGSGQESERRDYATAWIPDVDVFVRATDLVVRVNLSGVKREDVEITLSNGTLTISGERKVEQELQNTDFYVRERSWGNFRRSMTLPEGIDESSINASLEDGLLEVVIEGGADATEPRSVDIN